MPNTISKINGYSLKDNVSGYLTESVYYCEINVTTSKIDWGVDSTPADLKYSVTTVNSGDTFSKISGLINSGINVVLRESDNSSFCPGLDYSLKLWDSSLQSLIFHVNLPLGVAGPASAPIIPSISEVIINWSSSLISFKRSAIDITAPLRLPLFSGTSPTYTISGGNLKYIFTNISTSEPSVDIRGITYSQAGPGNIVILSNMTSSTISLSSSSGVRLSIKYLYPDNREMDLFEGYLYANGTPPSGAPLTEFVLAPNESALFVLGFSGLYQVGGSGGGVVLRNWYEPPVS